LYGIYHGIYLLYVYIPWCTASIAFLPGLNATKLLPFPGGHATQARKFVYSSISEDSGDGDTQQDRADGATGTGMTTIMHSRLAVQAADRGGPLAELCDDLPGFEARDITALLSDLPIPIPGGVPGMTVEEAIEV
jgi:hypothetical protein